jgi:hypothetical protein
MFEKIQKWYKQKLWTYTMVQNALEKGVITPEQFAEIEDLYNYGIIVDIKSVDGKGNVYAHVTLINKKSNIKETKLINAEGGTFGTWLNLFGDGMASLGVQIVNFIAKTDAF